MKEIQMNLHGLVVSNSQAFLMDSPSEFLHNYSIVTH